MPPTLEKPATDEAAQVHDAPLDHPVFDDSNLKAIAAKFRENWPGAPADGKALPPKKDAPSDKPSVDTTSKPDVGSPKEGIQGQAPTNAEKTVVAESVEDVPEPAPNMPVTRDHFKRLAQSKEAFKKQAETLKAEREAFAAKAAALEADLTKTKAALPPNLEEVQKALADSKRIAEENKRITEELETVNLERSPRFQNWWKSETEKHLKVARVHVPADKRAEFEKLLMEPASEERNAALDAIIDPLPNTSKRLAIAALENIEALKLQRDEALQRGSERWKELQLHEQEKAKQEALERNQRLQSLTEEAVRRAKAGYTAFQPTGDATKDGEIAKHEAFVRAVVAGRLDEDTMLNIPAAAVEMLHLRDNIIPALKAELAKQTELIKQLQGASPRAGDGKSAGGKQADTKAEKDGTSFASKVKSLMTG